MVNYMRQGAGKPIVMLHGWGDNLGTFDAVAALLQDSYEVIRLDLAGFGKSQPPKDAWDLKEYAQFVSEFLNKINVEPYAVVGHSNGGAIAIYGVANGLLKPQKLVLLASAGVRLPAKGRKLAWKIVARTGKVATAALPSTVRDSLRQKLYKSAGSDLLITPGMEATFKQIVAHDIQGDAAKLACPTIIFNGDKDTATPPEFAVRLHECIKNSKLLVLPNTDHFLHQSNAGEVAKGMKEFL